MTPTTLAVILMLAIVGYAAWNLRTLFRRHEGPKGDVDPNRQIVAYKTHRRIIGSLGVGLPFILVLWGFFLEGFPHLESSISDYYSLRTRDAFVGILFVVGWFLYAYRGYEPTDDQAGDWACLFALCVALFPNSGPSWQQAVHFISAVALFLIFAFFCLALFVKSDKEPDDQTPEKRRRNRHYRRSGWTIIGSLLAIGLSYLVLSGEAREQWKVVLVFETIMLVAFGWSWIVKGEWVFRDTDD